MPLTGVKNIVLVLSGKGGVGKSSVTLQLALSLTLQGKSVGILDIDLTGPSIPRLVGLEDAKITQAPGGWLPVLVHGASNNSNNTSTTTTTTNNDTNPPQPAPLHCMSLGFLLRNRGDSVIWRGPKKTAMIRQFLSDVHWGPTDYLLIDTPPGTSDEHIALAEQLLTLSSIDPDPDVRGGIPRMAGAVLVTTPQAIATSDVRKMINFCSKTRIPPLGVVENMSGFVCPCCGEVSNLFSKGGGEVMARDAGVPFLGSVPVDSRFGELVEGSGGGEEEEDSDEDGEGQGQGQGQGQQGNGVPPAVVDERPLVQRYKDCPSASIFGGFAQSLNDMMGR